MIAIGWSLILGLVVWVSLWAFGVKAFDSFMVLLALVLAATTWWIARPWVMRQLRRG